MAATSEPKDVIEEGRLLEVPAHGATGMDRRAFGEFCSERGELASYALGWVTGTHAHEGRMSVGIGAGKPGGGTFHAAVLADPSGHAFRLVDEPFESVPEGGPDLRADAARAHEDLDFVWWVADTVMLRDRRAWWMRHWLHGTRAIVTAPVFALEEPVLLVVNDADDELWQLIGPSDAGADGKLGHLFHLIDEDPSLIDVLDLEPGEEAERTRVGGPWTRRLSPPDA